MLVDIIKEKYLIGSTVVQKDNYTYIVRWSHYAEGKNRICECKIFLKDNKEMEEKGYAICSLKDRYIKNTGRKVSLTKALKKYGFIKNERKMFWDKYNEEIGF
jgi:hypothetical protein